MNPHHFSGAILRVSLAVGFAATTYALDPPAPSASTTSASTAPAASAPVRPETGKVDLNTADIPTLEAIPEIGTDFANAVVSSRPFRSVDDVNRILKLSPEKMNQLRAKVTVSPATRAAPTAPDPRTGVSKPSQANDGKATSREAVTERYEKKPGDAKTPSAGK